MTDDGVFGQSSDGLIGDDEESEYKCFVSPEKLRSILIDGDFGDVQDQCQGGLWISGRKRKHFGLYCPALKPIGKALWWRVWQRDDEYIEKLELDLLQFKALVDSYERKLRGVNAGPDGVSA